MSLAAPTDSLPPALALDLREEQRLAALYRSGLLDTPPEEQFDRIVTLAAQQFGVPIASVSLIDRNRQWLKAKVGCLKTETPRDMAICSLAMRQPDVLVIPDATLDPRVRNLDPVVGEPHIRFYAGAPLVTAEGHELGTLCVIDTEPRTFSAQDAATLQAFAALVMDEISLRDALRELRHLALYDSLTGLPNRTHFHQHLARAFTRADLRSEQLVLGLVDLDQFKLINDTLGHAAGDELLQLVATRLRASVGTSDLIARMGGDEFTIVLSDIRAAHDASAVMNRLRDAFVAPFVLRGQEVFVQFSAGLSLYPHDAADAESLLSQADTAMYRAKRSGVGYAFFNAQHDRRSPAEVELTAALHHSVSRDELLLHYQPVVGAQDGRVVGHEALIRWQRPSGLVSPAEFIPLAESAGLIGMIGLWVLRRAAQDLRSGLIERASVNVSALEFEHPEYARRVQRVLEEVGVDPDQLVLEITESALLDARRAEVVLAELRALGLRIALDDFGTGYSSLSAIATLPVQIMKINQSFTRDVGLPTPAGARALEVVRSIVALAGALQLEVVAEGVETPEQAQALMQSGCHYLQGYYFGRPAPLG
ncbi:putative bifunctional diguanylate cyclase/phosphodiesterase [Deinococcus koreensis]|uniref:Diguanylate cyclase n=1 Tax=Deinococcus koreensis TaxID=2054903 RepID=A0A2K3UUI3_9DEIO|nr:EAL domain-containing protein [Deinococcus koreensis]PNY80178.1 diguanylate cyclase [Deinococcus koreensis]